MGYGDPIEDPIELAHRFIKELDKGAVLRVSQALLAANERADALALIVKAANTFDGVAIDRGAFHLTRWTFQRKLFEHDGTKATGAVKYEAVASVTFEEDDVTPRIDDAIRAALAPREGGT